QFRPSYPNEIFKYISSLVKEHAIAWDVATGNGQVAKGLSPYFKKVFASDISEKQIEHAHRTENIFYSIQSAEQTYFPDNYFDLITVGQAIHWLKFSEFYSEVKRTGKEKSLLAILGYDL